MNRLDIVTALRSMLYLEHQRYAQSFHPSDPSQTDTSYHLGRVDATKHILKLFEEKRI